MPAGDDNWRLQRQASSEGNTQCADLEPEFMYTLSAMLAALTHSAVLKPASACHSDTICRTGIF